jgi:AcrR family transcriptional regulator
MDINDLGKIKKNKVGRTNMKKKVFLRKDLVLDAALNEFTTNDFEKASLNTIIKSAGISKGVFYYHFENKEALYLFLLKTCVDTKWKYINEQTQKHAINFDKMDIFEKFMFQAEFGIDFANQYPKYHALSRMFSNEMNNPIYQIAINHLGFSNTDLIASMIKESINRHEFKTEFDEAFIIKILSHLLLEFDQIFDEEGSYEKNKILSNLKHYINFIKYGLKA